MSQTPRASTEKAVLMEFINAYKNLPCLWDPANEMYSNKEARLQAVEIMLDVWQKFEPTATIDSVRKRIENMRTAYRRERKKVDRSKSIALDAEDVHKPSLWYYKYFTFIDKRRDGSNDTSSDEHEDHDYDGHHDEKDEPKRKKQCKCPIHKRRQSELHKHMLSMHDDDSRPREVMHPTPSPYAETSADAFGRSISMQLKELPRLQRCIAEKLIGDILFYAKIDQLSPTSSINFNQDAKTFLSRMKQSGYVSTPDSQSHRIRIKLEKQNIKSNAKPQTYTEPSSPNSDCNDIQAVYIEQENSD